MSKFGIFYVYEKYIASNLTKSKIKLFLYAHVSIFINAKLIFAIYIYLYMLRKTQSLSGL